MRLSSTILQITLFTLSVNALPVPNFFKDALDAVGDAVETVKEAAGDVVQAGSNLVTEAIDDFKPKLRAKERSMDEKYHTWTNDTKVIERAIQSAIVSELAYQQQPMQEFNATGLEYVTAKTVELDLSFVVYDYNHTAIVGFQGTVNAMQWLLVNMNIELTDLNFGNNSYGRVSEGFKNGFEKVKSDLMTAISSYKEIVLTGHSLGAALATLAAVAIANEAPDKGIAGLYLFGSPRVGDEMFVQKTMALLSEKQTDMQRFVLDADTGFSSLLQKSFVDLLHSAGSDNSEEDGILSFLAGNFQDIVTLLPPLKVYKDLGDAASLLCPDTVDCSSMNELHSLDAYRYSLYRLSNAVIKFGD